RIVSYTASISMAPVVACPVDTIGSNPTGSENSPKVSVPPTCGGRAAVVAVDCEPLFLVELEHDAATRQKEATTAQAPANLVSRRLIATPLAWSCTPVRHHAHRRRAGRSIRVSCIARNSPIARLARGP